MLLGADRLFRRFQQTGEPRLLGMVFDRTAKELLRVALHLTRDRHGAEDLLQSTFLTALEKAAQYDPARAVLPWLLAILANHARMANRRERRPLPRAVGEGTTGDVGDQLAARELAETCDRAVDALPEPYRHVLMLHLRHGMSGQEIAHALDRPNSTVRNQIARGLDLLRRRLPAGIASAAVLMTGGRGLAAVRAAVLARVPAGSAAAASLSFTLGVLLMSKKALVLLVLVLVAGMSWYSGALSVFTASHESTSTPTLASAAILAVAPVSPAPASLERAEVTAPPEGTGTGALHAEVVVKDENLPVAGMAFAVKQFDPASQITRIVGEGTTGTDGAADVASLPPGDYTFTLPGRSPFRACSIRPGSIVSVRVEIPRSRRIEGVVVDRTGRPVADAEVRSRCNPDSTLLCRSAADGTFSAEFLPDEVEIWARAAGRQPSPLHVLQTREKVRLVVGDAGTALSGLVLDEQGRPVAGAVVFLGIDYHLGTPFIARRMLDVRAGNDGTFRADWLPPGNLFVGALPADLDLARATGQWLDVHEEVAATVQLRLGDGARVSGRVVDADDRPVADAWIEASAMGDHQLTPFDHRMVISDTNGSFLLTGLLAGECGLRMSRPGDQSISQRVQLEPGREWRWHPKLVRGQTLTVRLLDPEGEPLPACQVHVHAETGTWSQLTEADGRCLFEHLPAKECRLRMLSNEGVPCADEQDIVPAGQELVVRVLRERMVGAHISGRVVDARGRPVSDCEVMFVIDKWERWQHVDRTNGTFRSKALPPGRHQLCFHSPDVTFGSSRREIDLAANQQLDLGDVVLQDAARLAVRIQAQDGAALHGVVLRIDTPGWPGSLDVQADEVDGVYRRAGLDAGSCVLHFFAADAVPQTMRLELGPGEHRELDLVARRGVPVVFELHCSDRRQTGIANGSLTIADAANQPVLVHSLRDFFDDHEHLIRRVRVALAPGNYRVTGRQDSERSSDFVVPAAPPAEPVVLDLR